MSLLTEPFFLGAFLIVLLLAFLGGIFVSLMIANALIEQHLKATRVAIELAEIKHKALLNQLADMRRDLAQARLSPRSWSNEPKRGAVRFRDVH